MILQAATTAAGTGATTANEPDFMMYAGSAVFLVGLAWAVMRWVGKTIKQDLEPSMSGKMRASMAIQAEAVPPVLVKEALAKGLVTSAQLATMSPAERQYLLATLRPKLEGSATAGAHAAPVLPLKPTTPATPVVAPQLRSTQAIPTVPGKPVPLPPLTPEQLAALVAPPAAAGTTPPTSPPMTSDPLGDELLPDSEGLRLHCPCCGTLLVLPAFPPFVAFCDQCGAKTAVRTEDQGRLIINTAPPGVTRRPVG